MYIYKAPKSGNPVLRCCTIKKEVFNKITKYNEFKKIFSDLEFLI